jgi:tetratricopeptide (TPR) repeat protein
MKAYDKHCQGNAVASFIHGESGIGKSALVRQFAARIQQNDSRALVFESRCYERESVPFKAFDGVIDAVTRYLVSAGPIEAAGLVPLHVNALVRVFPVLRRAEAIAKFLRPETRELEPAEMRERVFDALRDLFTRLANQQSVVIVIDDFQWADSDSLALLRALLQPPDAPPMLLLATIREESRRSAPGLSRLERDLGVELGQVQHIQLHGLSQDDASQLAQRLCRQVAPQLGYAAQRICEESAGHPLFIDEMIRYGAMKGEAPAALHLDAALWARVLSLEEEARSVLELVATSDAPIPKGTAANAARMDFNEFARWVSVLRVAKFVQTTGARQTDTVAIFHDRVRQAMIKHMSNARRRHCHERLALAMETTGGAPFEALATHWGGAGDSNKAYTYLRNACEQAEKTLAFDHAAQLYRRCLDLLDPRSPDELEVRTRLAHSLANAGRSAEAANAFLAAAKLSPEPTELNALASSHLLRSGHIDSGLEVLRSTGPELGLSIPKTPRSALAKLLSERALLRVRGLKFKRKPNSTVTKRNIARVDTTWGLAVGLGLIDNIRGAAIQAQHLRLALNTGDPYRIGRALSVEAAYRYSVGKKGEKAGTKVLNLAKTLAEEVGHPNLRGSCLLMAGLGQVCQGNFEQAETLLRQAEDFLRENCSGVGWEISSAQAIGLWASWYRGRFAEITHRLPEMLRVAHQKGDLYAEITSQIIFQPMVDLVTDQPNLARQATTEALQRWSQKGFHFQHYFHLFAQTQIDMYQGCFSEAHYRIEGCWKELRGSMLLAIQQNRIEALHCRGRALVGHAQERGGDQALLSQAQQIVKKLKKEDAEWSLGLALLLEAGACMVSQQQKIAASCLDQAVPLLDKSKMDGYAAVARYALGIVDQRDEEQAAASTFFSEQGIKNPARITQMFAPGITTIL